MASDGQTRAGDNDRFLRFWWEVSHAQFGWGRKWVLHPKGGGNRRWFGNVQSVIDWSEGARKHYRSDRVARILPGVPVESARHFVVEHLDVGFAWISRAVAGWKSSNLKAPTVYPHDETKLPELLGFLNSPVASYIVSSLNPTISFNVNDVTGLPWKESSPDASSR